MKAGRAMALAGCSLAAGAMLAAQQRPVQSVSRPYVPQARILRTQASEVGLAVVVRNGAGQPVYGLQAGDFLVLDDGQRRTPVAFAAPLPPPATAGARGGRPARVAAASPSAGPPSSVALFFDDFAMSASDLLVARGAATKFFERDPASSRRCAISPSSGASQMNFTTDHAALLARLKRLQPHTRMPAEGDIPGGMFSPYLAQLINMDRATTNPYLQEGMTVLKNAGLCNVPEECIEVTLDEAERTQVISDGGASDTLAALRRLVNYVALQPGQRVILLVSTGFLSANAKLLQQQVTEAALRAGVIVDSLDAGLLSTDPPGLSPLEQMTAFNAHIAASDAMQDLAAATGGEYFTNNNDLAGALGRLAAGPAAAYRLSFAVPSMPHDSKVHTLKVTLPGRAHLSIQARHGYVDPGPVMDPLAQMPAAALDAELAGADQISKVPAAIGARWQRDPAGRTSLIVTLQVRAARLPFATAHGISRQHLFFVAALYDAGGAFVAGREGALTLAYDKAQRARAAATGITANLPIPAPPGRYRLRALVREGLHGAMSSFTRTVVIPAAGRGR